MAPLATLVLSHFFPSRSTRTTLSLACSELQYTSSELGEGDEELPLAFKGHAAVLSELIIKAQHVARSPLESHSCVPDCSVELLQNFIFDRCAYATRILKIVGLEYPCRQDLWATSGQQLYELGMIV